MRLLGIALVLTAALSLGGCGDEEEAATPAASNTAEARAGGAKPLSDIDMSNLDAGATYQTQRFQPEITFTVPEGEWKLFGADSSDHIEIETTIEDPVDNATLGFHHVTQVFDPAKGGEQPGDAIPGPDDFAQWLADHPHLKTTEPQPVEALGLSGVVVDMRVKSSQPNLPPDCGKYEGECVAMFPGKIEAILYGSTAIGRFYILEQPDGKELVVEQFVDPASAIDVQGPKFEELLESASVDAS
jgi:hypothetical protein